METEDKRQDLIGEFKMKFNEMKKVLTTEELKQVIEDCMGW